MNFDKSNYLAFKDVDADIEVVVEVDGKKYKGKVNLNWDVAKSHRVLVFTNRPKEDSDLPKESKDSEFKTVIIAKPSKVKMLSITLPKGVSTHDRQVFQAIYGDLVRVSK